MVHDHRPQKIHVKGSSRPGWGKHTMMLRRPQDTLAGCCWLARLVDKVRASGKGQLPLLYRLSLGSPLGIDGVFLRHFGISFRQMRDAVIGTVDDEALAQWFLSQPRVTPETMAYWNQYAPKLGTPGYPGSLFRHVLTWFVYPKATKQPVHSLFDMIEQDEAP